MGKHRLRNRIKSIVGGLIDPDKDEQLKGSNAEAEDNYKEIIEILKEENQEDKSKLVELIEQFHNRYKSIYDRYDQITVKLKEKVRSKKEKQSSSSSSSDSDSDSDSDHSSNKNGKLKDKIYMAANTEIDELKRKLAVETEEKEALISQLQETENTINQLKLHDVQLREENSKILAEIRELNQKIEDMQKEKETSMITIEESNTIIAHLKFEKEGIESELQNLKGEFSEMKERLTTKEDEVSNLIQKLETTELKNQAQLEKLVDQKIEIEKQKEDELLTLEKKYEEKIEGMQKEFESISTQKHESDSLIECLRSDITNLNGDQERLLEENNIHVAEIKQLEKKIAEMSIEIQNGIQLKEQMIEQLEETIEDLRSDLEMKGDEINTMTETVRNLEVKIRLSTQKLRVTEQMLNETEHDHATKEEKLHEENKSLMEKISTLSQTITNVKREVQDKVNETLTGIDSLIVKFEEDYGHIRTRVNEITNEIQATQIQLKQMKEDMKKKDEEMVTKLKFSESENERLMKSLEDMNSRTAKKDKKINELESTILVKDEWISSFCEDKREAIKQLCIWADYHRDRYDHLQQLLMTTTGARGQRVS